MNAADLGAVLAGRSLGPTTAPRAPLADKGGSTFDALLTDLGTRTGTANVGRAHESAAPSAPRLAPPSERGTHEPHRHDGVRQARGLPPRDRTGTDPVRHAEDGADTRAEPAEARTEPDVDRAARSRPRDDDAPSDPSMTGATDGTRTVQERADGTGHEEDAPRGTADSKAGTASGDGPAVATPDAGTESQRVESPATPGMSNAGHDTAPAESVAGMTPLVTDAAPQASIPGDDSARLDETAGDTQMTKAATEALRLESPAARSAAPEHRRVPVAAEGQQASRGRAIDHLPADVAETLGSASNAGQSSTALDEASPVSPAEGPTPGAGRLSNAGRAAGLANAWAGTPSAKAADGARAVARQVLTTLLAAAQSGDAVGEGAQPPVQTPASPPSPFVQSAATEAFVGHTAQRLLEQAVDRATGMGLSGAERDAPAVAAVAGFDTSSAGGRQAGHGSGAEPGSGGRFTGIAAKLAAFELASATGLAVPVTLQGELGQAASVAPTASSTTPADLHLAQQVVQTISLAWRGQTGEANVRLNPEHLGEVTVALKVTDGVVTATLRAETTAARDWIQAHEAELRQGLQEQGLTLNRLVVTADGGRGRDDQGQDPPRQQRQRRGQAGGQPAPRFELEA